VTTDSSKALVDLLLAVIHGDQATALRLLDQSPALATAQVESGATRHDALSHYFKDIEHYVYAGDSALHVAAAAYRPEVARRLLAAGANVRAKNRRGAEPLHYAADGLPDSANWNPEAQSAVISCLVAAGADPNCVDNSGVAPLHRAVRTRCAAAVRTLLEAGADPLLVNRSGSTPMLLATQTTGRGGSGSLAARQQQAEIVRLLERRLATR
jgi:ankyrin repeat protein